MAMANTTVRVRMRCLTLFPLLVSRPFPPVRFLHCLATGHHHHLFLSPPLSLSSSFQHRTYSLKPHFPLHQLNDRALFPWPEWLHFANWVSSIGYSNGSVQPYEFVQHLPLDFLRLANQCLAFANDHPNLLWSLPREDIEVVVDSFSPVLFKDASSVARRMESFLASGINDAFSSDKPNTVDLMRFLLSYTGMSIVSPENIPISNRVESSVRKLFSELAKSSGISVKSPAVVENQVPEGHGRPPWSSGKNIEMKRGDWICPRCSFMNFAKNDKCLECEETRPRKYLTGKEWECPQCNFLNFGKNVVCLRCDCKSPSASLPQSLDFISDSAANSSSFVGNMEGGSAEMEEKQQPWFSKMKELELSSDTGSVVADADFLVSKITRNLGSNQKSDIGSSQTHDVDGNIVVKISQCIDEALGEKSSAVHITNEDAASSNSTTHYELKDLPSAKSEDDFSETMPLRRGENRFVVSRKKDRSLTSPIYKRRVAMEQGGNNNYVPFVPFPPGYFATNKPKDKSESTDVLSNNSDTIKEKDGPTNQAHKSYSDVNQTSKSSDSQFGSSYRDEYSQTRSKTGTDSNNTASQSSENQSPRDIWRGKSLEGSAVKEPDPLDMSEEAKAERWFRRVSQIKDISELSQIPDEDFPSIMPMRKGVNRFVVSKRKTPMERRLTSSKYQRNRPIVISDPVEEENDSS